MATLAASFKKVTGIVRSNSPLSDDQIMRAAPSIFAQAAHESRSARYAYIPTIDVINGLRSEGFFPFMATQAASRIEGKQDFTKHMLRFRKDASTDGEAANEIILINSHDGSSSYQMLAGCFRFVCHNGMICGETVEDLRIRHSGNIIDNVIEGAYRIVDQFELVDGSRDAMQSTQLSPGAQNAFTRAALALRYEDPNAVPIEAERLNMARRNADKGADLWHTFNRVQENMIRGGLRGRTANGQNTRTREVKGVSQSVNLNRALWTLAEEMRRLVG